jgi:hypothetical protein
VLQEGEFHRVGGEQIIRVSVRVVSATNRDLAALVTAEKFREDLYYRLSVVPIRESSPAFCAGGECPPSACLRDSGTCADCSLSQRKGSPHETVPDLGPRRIPGEIALPTSRVRGAKAFRAPDNGVRGGTV